MSCQTHFHFPGGGGGGSSEAPFGGGPFWWRALFGGGPRSRFYESSQQRYANVATVT